MSLYIEIEPDLYTVQRLIHAAETICRYGSEDANATGLNESEVAALEEVLKVAGNAVARVIKAGDDDLATLRSADKADLQASA